MSHFYLDDYNTELPLWLSKSLEIGEFKTRLTSSEFINVVYEKDGKLVGYLAIKNKNHIYHLFVDEAYQGRGISKLLWQNLISESNEKIYTVRSSIFAIPIYKQFGFKITEPQVTKDGISFQPMKLTL